MDRNDEVSNQIVQLNDELKKLTSNKEHMFKNFMAIRSNNTYMLVGQIGNKAFELHQKLQNVEVVEDISSITRIVRDLFTGCAAALQQYPKSGYFNTLIEEVQPRISNYENNKDKLSKKLAVLFILNEEEI